jgi:hypothetical protein
VAAGSAGAEGAAEGASDAPSEAASPSPLHAAATHAPSHDNSTDLRVITSLHWPARAARPMVVVMIDGHPFTPTTMRDGAGRSGAPMAAFRRELFEDAIPLVEATYRVEADASQRGIVGFAQFMNRCVTHWHFYKFTREATSGRLRAYNTI